MELFKEAGIMSDCYSSAKALRAAISAGHRLSSGVSENQRNAVETAVAGDVAETLPADGAVAQRGVAVDPAAAGLQGVVQVHAPQVAESDDAVELLEEAVAGRRRRKVVARGEGVAGVYADPTRDLSSTCSIR